MNQRRHFFSDLAERVEHDWNKTTNDLDAFTDIALTALREQPYAFTREQLDRLIANWMMECEKLPEQVNVHNTFGQPPVTLFNNGRFVVDIYIWLGCDTSIHSHGFRGAFKVLHGKSLHEIFDIEITKQVSPDVALTKLGKPELELLGAGDVRRIDPGTGLTHRVIHLEEPTITLCVKTINEPELSQWHHFANISDVGGLAVKKRNLDGGLIKQVYYFQYLARQNITDAETFLNAFIERQDRSTLMNLCEEIASGGYDIADDVAQTFLERVYAQFAEDEWFRRYEISVQRTDSEIIFAQSPSALARLATHFVNIEAKRGDAEPFLNKLAARPVSKKEIEELILSVIDKQNSHVEEQLDRMHAFLST